MIEAAIRSLPQRRYPLSTVPSLQRLASQPRSAWIPAFAGMTVARFPGRRVFPGQQGPRAGATSTGARR